MDQALGIRLAAELGITQARIEPLRRIPYEQAVAALEEIKKDARANYRKLAFKYHPDRNPGDVEAEAAFKALGEILKQIEGLRVQRAQPQPMVMHYYVPVNIQVRRAPSYTSTSSSTTTSTMNYDARRVVFIRG